MYSITEILDELNKRGFSQKDIAEKLGVTPGVVTGWKSGRLASWEKYAVKLAGLLGIDPFELVDDVPKADANFAAPNNLIPLPQTKKVPLLGDIACGEPITAIQNVVDFVTVPASIHADMALICKGDSMINARIFDGDVVYIRQQEDVENGEIAAVLIGDEATLKRVYKSPGKIVLAACNPMFEDLVYINGDAADVHIIGKAVAFTSIIRV